MDEKQCDHCKLRRYDLLYCKVFQLRAALSKLLRSLPVICRLIGANEESCNEYEPDDQRSPEEGTNL